eukprot:jgi/Picsp_1/2890/NSC_01115-R1_---NA---
MRPVYGGLMTLLLAATVLNVPTLLAVDISDFIRSSKIDRDCFGSMPCVVVFCKVGALNFRWSCQTNIEYTGEFRENCDYYNITESEYNKKEPKDQLDFLRQRDMTGCYRKYAPSDIKKYRIVGYYQDAFCPTHFPISSKKYKDYFWSECQNTTSNR